MESRKHEIVSAVKQLQSLQADRAHTYTLFEEGHKIYLHASEVKGFQEFQKLVLEVTQDFKRISLSIIDLEKQLRDQLDAAELADLVRLLQDHEKEKLHLTAELQMKMKKLQDSPDERHVLDEQIAQIKKSLKRLVQEINECLDDIKYEIDS